MIDLFLKYIRSKSRSQWRSIATRLFSLIRNWFADNGEVGAVISLVAGMAFVLFFKLILILLVIVSLCVYGLYCIAEE